MSQRINAVSITQDDENGIALGPLEELLGYHLRRAYYEVSSDFAQTFTGSPMRQVLFGVLSVISANPGINQGQVGKVLGIQRTNMVALVNQLVDLDFVVRRIDRSDRRAFSLVLSQKGEQAIAQALTLIRQHEDRLLASFSEEERATLASLLQRIRS